MPVIKGALFACTGFEETLEGHILALHDHYVSVGLERCHRGVRMELGLVTKGVVLDLMKWGMIGDNRKGIPGYPQESY